MRRVVITGLGVVSCLAPRETSPASAAAPGVSGRRRTSRDARWGCSSASAWGEIIIFPASAEAE